MQLQEYQTERDNYFLILLPVLLVAQQSILLAIITTALHCWLATSCPLDFHVIFVEMLPWLYVISPTFIQDFSFFSLELRDIQDFNFFSFLNFMMFLLVYFCNFSRFVWMAVLPFNIWIASSKLMSHGNLKFHTGTFIAISKTFFFFFLILTFYASIKILRRVYHRVIGIFHCPVHLIIALFWAVTHTLILLNGEEWSASVEKSKNSTSENTVQ